MPAPPFEIIRCSWPRPVVQAGDEWISEPEWDAPLLPRSPQPVWADMNGELCWSIDWCQVFDGGLHYTGPPRSGGEMRGFHVVFQIRINGSGRLVFWDDDGSIIRLNGEVIHTDRTTHPLQRSEIDVKAGEHLEIAQWQNYGVWLWGAHLVPAPVEYHSATRLLLSYLEHVQRRLREPNGPVLKMFTHGGTPFRAVIALYSMILNGYRPSQVLLFGEYQWSEQSRKLFAELLPFAQIVSTWDVLGKVQAVGGAQLVHFARRHWFVMKACISLLYPPEAYCVIDDDLFILDRVDDALVALREHNLVFAADVDYGEAYLNTWGREGRPVPLPTGRLNGGLYWLRNTHDPRSVAAAMLRMREPVWYWEQGFLAIEYAHEACVRLPSQRYFYPYCDGLPGGIIGYDYAGNPCDFASIHFGGLAEKPSDADSVLLAPSILSRYMRLQ